MTRKKQKPTKEEIIADYRQVKATLHKDRLTRTEYLKHGNYGRRIVEGIFGNWTDFKKAMDEIPLQNYNVSKAEVAAVARKLYRKHGKLTQSIMVEEGYAQSTLKKTYGSFSHMMEEIDLPMERYILGRVLKDRDYFLALQQLEANHGYVNSTLITKHCPINRHAYMHRFGTVGEACLYAGVRHIGQDTIEAPEGEAITAIREVANLIGDDYYHTELSFNWLRNEKTNSPLPIDGYFPASNLVVEYHGPHHYNPDYWINHTPTSIGYEEVRRRDHLKKKLIRQQGLQLLTLYDYEAEDIPSVLKKHTIHSKTLNLIY